ncbi:hypothetical protein OHC33_008964 [Knufia fluminis]|uniref:Ketoreductase domain-containing protein n=1 Tax=Knufia fluminis TaxID=191047 RepID=A0AAN8EF10_9EURO|nr:hypothetical protein OHC33_008964 [Knufia fluminis]
MSTSSNIKTWLITGSSSGFGLILARTILARGHNVIATSRNPSRTPEYVKEIESTSRGKWLTLDVSADAPTIQATVHETHKLFGKIDVLVNNAGYSVLGMAEDIPEDQAKAQFEVNLWGAIRVTKAVLPIMRKQGSGTIAMFSSIAGMQVNPTNAIYSASKAGLEAWSDGMAQEIASFGIRVLVIEPGAFRTNFLGGNALRAVPTSEPYKGTVGDATLQRYQSMGGKQAGDPAKACERIVNNVERGLGKDQLGKAENLRLPLGQDCYDRLLAKTEALSKNWANTKEEALGLQVDE